MGTWIKTFWQLSLLISLFAAGLTLSLLAALEVVPDYATEVGVAVSSLAVVLLLLRIAHEIVRGAEEKEEPR